MKLKAAYFATKNQIAVLCEIRLAASTAVAKDPKHVFVKIKGSKSSLGTKKGTNCSCKHNTENSVT